MMKWMLAVGMAPGHFWINLNVKNAASWWIICHKRSKGDACFARNSKICHWQDVSISMIIDDSIIWKQMAQFYATEHVVLPINGSLWFWPGQPMLTLEVPSMDDGSLQRVVKSTTPMAFWTGWEVMKPKRWARTSVHRGSTIATGTVMRNARYIMATTVLL